MKFAKRMDRFGEGIFSRLAEIKNKRISEGKEVIDLSIGAPNIPPAEHIRKALCEEAMKPENYVYAISDTKKMLDTVADWYKRRYDVELDPDTEICSLLGSQEGLAHIALSIADEGDIVMVPDPCYPVFGDGPQIAGAELYYMPLKKEMTISSSFRIFRKKWQKGKAYGCFLSKQSYNCHGTGAVLPGSGSICKEIRYYCSP